MAKAKKQGSGWHKQKVRHSRAKKFGKAGGKYKAEKMSKRIKTMLKENPKLKNMTFKQLKNKGIFLRYRADSDKDGTINIKDCQPLNKKEQDLKEKIKKAEEKGVTLIKKGFKKAKELGKAGLKKAKELTIKAREEIARIQAEKRARQEEAVKTAVLQATATRLIPAVSKAEVEAQVKAEIKEEQAEIIEAEREKEFEFRPIEKIFQEPQFRFTPETAQKLAERTQEALREAKRKRIDDLRVIDLSELNDNELKEISIKLGTGFFGAGNKFENELKRRIRETEKIDADLTIETMRAEKTAKERINKEIEAGVKAGGYIWDDWFK